MKCRPVKRLGPDATVASCTPVPKAGTRLFAVLDAENRPEAIMLLEPRGKDFVVASIQVKEEAKQRRRLGTRLYETAVELACKEGARLLSDHERSQFAEAFWRKQVGKGRAMCAEPGKGKFYANPTHHLPASVVATLPEPTTDGTYRWWPCRRYGVTKPCEVGTLEGVRTRRGKKRR